MIDTSADGDFLDETGDKNPERILINADPARRARYEAYRRQNELALAVYALREAIGMTQVDLAGAAGMSQENLSRIERSGDVKVSTIERIAAAVGARLELTAVLPDGTRVDLLSATGTKRLKRSRARAG
jgi:DNA-binding phage protein